MIFFLCILIDILLKYVPKGPIDDKPTLVQVTALAYFDMCDIWKCHDPV